MNSLLPVFMRNLLFIAMFIAGCQRGPAGDEVTFALASGRLVSDAILKYQRSNGRFPEELNALVPVYIAAIPPPVPGDDDWTYRCLDDGERFYLEYDWGDSGPAIYTNSGRHWVTDTK